MMLRDLKDQKKLETFLPDDLDIFRRILKAQRENDLQRYEELQNELTDAQINAFTEYKHTLNMEILEPTPSMTTAYAQARNTRSVVGEAPSVLEPEETMPSKKKKRMCHIL
ncbi:hypothetical protein [Candidatus Berkiella aquae]|uniref:Uncharacterized protein n=1 Tax=Candidatus Berkiella aquae TaxID=295108 RepID=A0A0Q9YZK9_9GAMM|nr:hypothetical protein [Candidatus Berkiella aquae]MCS5712167.1 hypothetical protein [Candidatus Berkiella aquae]